MATVNHTGTITTDETWSASDDHHITGNTQFDGGALGDPLVVTVSAGTTVYFDGSYILLRGVDSGDWGSVVFNGTEAQQVTFDSDPTIQDPQCYGFYTGIVLSYSCFDGQFVQFRHGGNCIRLNQTRAASLEYWHVDNLCYYHCTNCVVAQGAASTVGEDYFVVDGFCIEERPAGNWWVENNGQQYAYGSIKLSRIGLEQAYGSDYTTINTGSHTSFIMDKVLCLHAPLNMFVNSAINMNANKSINYYLTDVYVGFCNNTAGLTVYNNIIRGTVGVSGGVIYRTGADGINQDNAQSTSTVNIGEFDIVDCMVIGLRYRTAALTYTYNSVFASGNQSGEYVGASGDGAQPDVPRQWYDTDGTEEPTMVWSLPHFPLDTENVVEGTPTTTSMAVTFDSAVGVTGRRCLGVGFVRYGTSSGNYTSTAGLYPKTPKERLRAFTAWRSSAGSFKTTGHSVTIDKLTPGTDYYYQPCFIDPIGRYAYGTEESFSTLAAGGGGGMPNVGEGGIS